MRRLNLLLRKLFFIISTLAFFLSGCATIPRNFPIIQEEEFDMLPSGGKLYLWADVDRARPILDAISFQDMSLQAAAGILDQTRTAAAVFNSGGINQGFFMNLKGNFPTFRAGLSMAFSRAWRRQRSITGNSYWHSPLLDIGVAMGSTLALVSMGDPFILIPLEGNQIQSPDGFNEFYRGGVIAGWINEPDETINLFFNSLGIPLQIPADLLFFSVFPITQSEEEHWELVFHIRTPSISQARAVFTLFTLARAAIIINPFESSIERSGIQDFLPLLFANPIHREENILILRSAIMDTQELSLLFENFLVYSN